MRHPSHMGGTTGKQTVDREASPLQQFSSKEIKDGGRNENAPVLGPQIDPMPATGSSLTLPSMLRVLVAAKSSISCLHILFISTKSIL